jgi:thiol-disulfide isomerase/thioredoxin
MAPQKRHRRTNKTATRKGGKIRKRHYPKTVRGHRHSATGKIFPLLNVRSPNQLHHIKKYLNQGPITVFIIVADWCGHCQNLKPHIEAAAKLPQRNVQIMTVRDDMLSGYNKTVSRFNHSASPIEADGYPTVLLLGPNGNKLSEISPTKEALNSAVVNVAPVAVEAGLASGNSLISNSKRISVNPRNGLPQEEIVENEIISPDQNSSKPLRNSAPLSFEHLSNDEIIREEPVQEPKNNSMRNHSVEQSLDIGVSPTINSITFSTNANASQPSKRTITETVPSNAVSKNSTTGLSESEAEEITSLEAVPVSPDVRPDVRKPAIRGGTIIGGGKRGGSLYGIMSQTAYRLAPAAVLLATAAAVMKKKTRGKKKAFRHSIKKRSTIKQRRYKK